jgi:gamma-glutamylcyclotransferase (GGCT)/AIG2-like uncharacterized protein YtfP
MRLNELLLEKGEPPTYYFAYGMLTDPKIMGGFELVGIGELRNFAFELAGFANVVPTPGEQVLGSLWIINRSALGQLDQVEGYPHFYDRKSLPVYVDNIKYEAFVYMMRPDSRDMLAGRKPKVKYVQSIRRGYKHAGIPLDQLKNAQAAL